MTHFLQLKHISVQKKKYFASLWGSRSEEFCFRVLVNCVCGFEGLCAESVQVVWTDEGMVENGFRCLVVGPCGNILIHLVYCFLWFSVLQGPYRVYYVWLGHSKGNLQGKLVDELVICQSLLKGTQHLLYCTIELGCCCSWFE